MGQEKLTAQEPTIVAVSTPFGSGGLAVIRMSGQDSFEILRKVWKGADPESFLTHTAHLGWILDSSGEEIDQVVATVYRSPNSYTGEDVIEISCHGSPWIQRSIVNRLIESGASGATAGEFTMRAFSNGRLDLAQAEGVADMIASSSKAAARLASSQLKGDFSRKLNILRQKLIDLGALLELELDFSEEDVEFADRVELIKITGEILGIVTRLASSFKAGNAFKQGIPVAIAGVPNAGKSTLLNALLGEDKAIVSDIPGTTRDVIEDSVEISGILFRFIDTAGLRESEDKIERIGVERAKKKIEDSSILLYLIDPTQDVAYQMGVMRKLGGEITGKRLLVATKTDVSLYKTDDKCVAISAKNGSGIEELRNKLVEMATEEFNPELELIVTNARHYEALRNAEKPLKRLIEGLENGLSGDLLAQDLREAEHHLGEITGDVTSTDVLHTIFSRYCIGK